MADLFPDHPGYRSHNEHTNYPLSADVQYPPHPQQQQQQQHPQQQQQPQQQAPPQPQQQPAPPTSSSSNTPSSPEENSPIQTTPKSELPGTPQPRQEGKQQATFLTKLYALLERPENHHMIRWDPQGEHIIVEKPEQLAIHVLPSVYRQSRFASFSRQLNIYGFMRKVNLRNVDPAIDDPDASTWSHPTLNRHSSAEVVANFKRRVPPRIPKSKKRAEEAAAAVAAAAAQNMAPRGNVGLAPMQAMSGQRNRAYTSPGSFQPLGQPGAVSWGTPYPRAGIPPLDVPSHHAGGGMFTHQPGYGHPPPGQGLPPVEESRGFNGAPYSAPGHLPPASAYPPYPEQSQWQFNGAPGHPGNNSGRDLSSLLNPSSGGGGYQRPPLNTYGAQGFPAMPGAQHSPASPSDSRPNTGYSVASAASVGYDDGTKTFAHDYSRPSSSHHPRQLSPGPASRPGSSHAPPSFQQPSSLSIRRARRHSQAQSPYPHPPGTGGYDGPVGADGRPSTSPPDGHHDHHMSRARSMVALGQPPSSAGGEGAYSYGPGTQNGHGDFAYSAAAIPGAGGEPLDAYSHSVRPSTGASSLSTASQANTPPVTGGTDADINRSYRLTR